MKEAYIRSTFITDQREFMEHFQNCEQIRELLEMPKRPQAPKHILWGLGYDKSGNQVPKVENFENYDKDAHENSVQNGSDAFPNELMRFRIEATPIWDTIQKRCKNEVIT